MGRDTKASDWKYAGIASVSASAVIGRGYWLFSFKSDSAGVWEDVYLVANTVNVALPGFSVDLGLPDFNAEDLSWSSIKSERAFSISEMIGCEGRFKNVGASAAFVGYSELYLSAKKAVYAAGAAGGKPSFVRDEWLFRDQLNNGYSVGIDASMAVSGQVAVGTFKSLGTWVRDYVGPVTVGVIKGLGLMSGLFAAGEALRRGRGLAISHAFARGYATGLAEVTDKGGYSFSEEEFNRLVNMPWWNTFDGIIEGYKTYGHKFNINALSDAETCGIAAILQVCDSYYKVSGEQYILDMSARHRAQYGEEKNHRRLGYLDRLMRQIEKGTNFGIEL